MNIMEASKQDPNQAEGNKFLRLVKSRCAAVVLVVNKAFSETEGFHTTALLIFMLTGSQESKPPDHCLESFLIKNFGYQTKNKQKTTTINSNALPLP